MVALDVDKSLFNEARRYIPGGVNSPVRSFKSVGGAPLFVKEAKGSKIYGECGREFTQPLRAGAGFIDYCLSWGALILGHAHPEIIEALCGRIRKGTSFGTATKLETELAKLIVEAVPSIEQVRLVNSGTEAVMSAIRLARAWTKKNKLIKFVGSYHGHADYLLVKGGSGQATLGIPNSLGVPKEFVKHTLVLPYNDIRKLELAVKRHEKNLAAIIVEPIAANCGVLLPKSGFLEGLRRIADRYNILLIFDEVITGFRLLFGGSEGYFDVKPDLACLGKIIGGGLPVGAFGGKREIMQLLAPEGGVYQAGTLSGNPIAVTGGIVTLNILKRSNPYETLEKRTKELCEAIKIKAGIYKIKLKVNYIASMFSVFFVDKEVVDYRSASLQDSKLFKRFFHGLLKEGVYFSPSGFEANFLSTAHTQQDLEKTLKAIDIVLKNLGR